MSRTGLSGNHGVVLAVMAGVAVAGGMAWTFWGWNARAALSGTNFYYWFLLCMCGELLRTNASSGKASMAACAHIAAMLVLKRPEAMAVVGISSLLADRLIQKRTWWQSSFEAGALMCAVGLARIAFDALAPDGWKPSSLVAAGYYLPILAAAGIYFVSTFLTRSAWSTLEDGGSFSNLLSTPSGPKAELLAAGTLLSLGILLAIQFKQAGALGAVTIAIPVIVAKHGLDQFTGSSSRLGIGSHERPRIAA
jgi:hypothetical protein